MKVIENLSNNSNQAIFRNIKRGIERESLRISLEGRLSKKPHFKGLGSSLTNSYITTDYSESQLELITPPLEEIDKSLQFLSDLHKYCYSKIDEEILWAASMPCFIGSEDEIPLAQFGSSNSGKMKNIYRRGLKIRYGSAMQIISGIHYNFSPSDAFWDWFIESEKSGKIDRQKFIDDKYLALARNFYRYGWIIPYLFGSSPAICQSFIKDQKNIPLELKDFDGKGTLYLPYATSLRMSDLGYQSNVQANLEICYNSLERYLSMLDNAIFTKDPRWKKFGVKKNGEYLQLNDCILQIENEYYGLLRPKRILERGERPARALRKRGVEYIEVRSMDINPFSLNGISKEQILFMDVFLFFCLMEDSEGCSSSESKVLINNFKTIVTEGRRPGLELKWKGRKKKFVELSTELFDNLQVVALEMDRSFSHQDNEYQNIIELKKKAITDPDATYSGRFLNDLSQGQTPYSEYVLNKSIQYKEESLNVPINTERMKFFEEKAIQSHKDQIQLEKNINSLEDYIYNYYHG